MGRMIFIHILECYFCILLILNTLFFLDVSTTVIIKPGPVIDFLSSNQQVMNPCYIDWEKVMNLSMQFMNQN